MTTEERRPVAELTYEQAREELVHVVSRLEAGTETLEGSLDLWERGEALAARCQEWLDGARRRLDTARAEHADDGQAEGLANGGAAIGPGTDGPEDQR